MTAPDHSVSDDALTSGGPAGEGGFDPTKPFTTRDGKVVKGFTTYDTGDLQGVVEGLPRAWLSDGRHVNGRRELDLINTPVPTVSPTPAGDMGAKLTFAEAIDIVCGSSWLHLGDDAYSQGLDAGARKQVEASVSALKFAAALTPAGDMAGEDDAAFVERMATEDGWYNRKPLDRERLIRLAREGARREPVAGDGWKEPTVQDVFSRPQLDAENTRHDAEVERRYRERTR